MRVILPKSRDHAVTKGHDADGTSETQSEPFGTAENYIEPRFCFKILTISDNARRSALFLRRFRTESIHLYVSAGDSKSGLILDSELVSTRDRNRSNKLTACARDPKYSANMARRSEDCRSDASEVSASDVFNLARPRVVREYSIRRLSPSLPLETSFWPRRLLRAGIDAPTEMPA